MKRIKKNEKREKDSKLKKWIRTKKEWKREKKRKKTWMKKEWLRG